MFLNIFDVSSERSESMGYPFDNRFRGQGISVGPEGISVGPGNSVNIGGQQWFGRGKHRKGFRLGDVRATVLVLLAEQPMHGYQIIQEIAERSGGVWQPSPGSIYPVLQQLEDEGLVLIEQTEGRKVASLTEAGRAYVEENRAEFEEVWKALSIHNADEGTQEVRNLSVALKQVGTAAKQVAKGGTDSQIAEARKVLADARRRLYLILAEDDADDQDVGQRPSP
jgi:DNA-binding PadR family transcriptional regulator